MINKIFSDFLCDFKSIFSEVRYGTRTRKLTVAKGFCTPARNIVTGALLPYGVRIYDYKEYPRNIHPLQWLRQMGIASDEPWSKPLPMATFADVTVSEDAAAWAEYLLLRTGKLYVSGEYVNPRNQRWAAQHGGRMPPQWEKGEPWIEASCEAGRDAWRDVRNVLQERKINRK